jgi:ribosomal protein S8
MAIFVLKVKPISRSSKGYTNMLDVASYRSEEILKDEQEKKSFLQSTFQKKDRVLDCGISGPKDTPKKYLDRKTLWKAVEKREGRKDSRLAKEIILNLPKDCTPKQHKKMVLEFVDKITGNGYIADWSIHKPNKNDNHHAHILCTDRRIKNNKFVAKKDTRDNSKQALEIQKDYWERIQNKYLIIQNEAPVYRTSKKKKYEYEEKLSKKKKIPFKKRIKSNEEIFASLRLKEYHLLKRAVKDWLDKKEKYVILNFDEKSNEYKEKLLFPSMLKKKVMQEKFRKVVFLLAKKEYPKENKELNAYLAKRTNEKIRLNNELKAPQQSQKTAEIVKKPVKPTQSRGMKL